MQKNSKKLQLLSVDNFLVIEELTPNINRDAYNKKKIKNKLNNNMNKIQKF